jgi:hypothetical protein
MRSYHFMRKYPDRSYKEKIIRIAKGWAWATFLIICLTLIWALLGAPVSYGGKAAKRATAVMKCIKNSDALIWKPSTNPDFISHYEVYAAKRRRPLLTKARLARLTPIVTTKALTTVLPKQYRRNRLYFFTVQAVSYGGIKSRPATPVSCLQKGQGK